MKIYTKAGDQGITSLCTGEKIRKDSVRVEAYGTIDEFDAALGMARALCCQPEIKRAIYDLQVLLQRVMADVASIGENAERVTKRDVENIEQIIDRFSSRLPPQNHFLIPGDSKGSAALNIARTVARRSERWLWRLNAEEQLNEHVLVLMNRLSDLCFVFSRFESETAR